MHERVPFRWTRRDAQQLPVEVTGVLPAWLRGQLVRLAPAVFEAGAWRAAHLFDALGLVYGFTFDGQNVSFGQCLLKSDFAQDVHLPRPSMTSFDTPSQRSLLQRLLRPVPRATDNANVNVVPFDGGWLALTESPFVHVLDPQTLASRGHYRFEDRLPKGLFMTAHPQFDTGARSLVNVGTTVGPKNVLGVFRHDAGSQGRVVEGRRSFKHVPYVHSFGLSTKHAVIVDHPLSLEPQRLLFSNRGFIQAARWRPERGTRLWKLERRTGSWTAYRTETLFCFHTVNTFDDGQDVVVDLLAYDDPSVIGQLTMESLAASLPALRPRLLRARLVKGRDRVELEQLGRDSFEFPIIPSPVQGQSPTSTIWGAAFAPGSWETTLVRLELETGELHRYSEPGMVFGEPVFVPRPGAPAATTGVILTVGTGPERERSTLLVLDAERLEPVARCHVDLHLPFGFHGSFRASG